MQLNTLGYNSLVSSIPTNWKKQLKNKCNREHIEKAKQKHTDPEVKIDGKMINLFKLTTTKKMYQALVDKKIEEGTAIDKWISRFPMLNDTEWGEIYKIREDSK